MEGALLAAYAERKGANGVVTRVERFLKVNESNLHNITYITIRVLW